MVSVRRKQFVFLLKKSFHCFPWSRCQECWEIFVVSSQTVPRGRVGQWTLNAYGVCKTETICVSSWKSFHHFPWSRCQECWENFM